MYGTVLVPTDGSSTAERDRTLELDRALLALSDGHLGVWLHGDRLARHRDR